MIRSLQGRRFYFAVLIFLNRLVFLSKTPQGNYWFANWFHNGEYSVVFFFLLSGFFIPVTMK